MARPVTQGAPSSLRPHHDRPRSFREGRAVVLFPTVTGRLLGRGAQSSQGTGTGLGSGLTTAASFFRSRYLRPAVFGIPGNPLFPVQLRGDSPCCAFCCCGRCRRLRWVTSAGAGGSSPGAQGSASDSGCTLDSSEAQMVESRLFRTGDGRPREERAGSGDPSAGPPPRR